jgi:hypothetical protein
VISKEKILKLRESVAHCAPIDGFPAEYLARYAEPSAEGACLSCGEARTFTWGVTHGEGFCCKCHWPARLYHFIKDAEGKETRVVRLLQYHPDQIILNEEEDE